MGLRCKLSASKSQKRGKVELEGVSGTTKADLKESDLTGVIQPVGGDRSGIRVEVTYSQSSAPALSSCCPQAFSPRPLGLVLVRGPHPNYSPLAWHCTIFSSGTANSGWQPQRLFWFGACPEAPQILSWRGRHIARS